jgi:hypothetical protein
MGLLGVSSDLEQMPTALQERILIPETNRPPVPAAGPNEARELAGLFYFLLSSFPS